MKSERPPPSLEKADEDTYARRMLMLVAVLIGFCVFCVYRAIVL